MQTVKHNEFTITPTVKRALLKIIDERIHEAHVTKEDFTELKNIVKDVGVKIGELAEAQKETKKELSELAEAQKETKKELGELAEAQKETKKELSELAEAQKETKKELSELAEAQKETQKEVGRIDETMRELAEAQKKTEIEIQGLAKGLKETRGEVGGLSRSMSYAFENEAYRLLPGILKKRYGIEVTEKIVRADIGGREINIFGRAVKEGSKVLLVGESKLRLDERRDKKRGEKDIFSDLTEKAESVIVEYGDVEIIKVLITHYATKGFIKKAQDKGIIVVQSFEW